MLLFKCSCGHWFTTKDDVTPEFNFLKCQSCGNKLDYSSNPDAHILKKALERANMTIQKVPDVTKISFSFEA